MILHFPAQPGAPVACDMTSAPDTPEERLAAYRRLFERELIRRERRPDAVVLTLRGDAREALETLVPLEAACCAFLDYRVDPAGGEVAWTITDPGAGPGAAETLDAYYSLAGGEDVSALVLESSRSV